MRPVAPAYELRPCNLPISSISTRSRPPSRRQQAFAAAAAGESRRPAARRSSRPRFSPSLNEREQLGSTGFGQGVAIPHGKIDGLTGIYGLFARLGEPVDYKAIDGRPVDLVFLLLSPPDAGAEHLKALAAISRVTRDAATLEKMRGARSRDALAAVLMGADERDAA